MTRTKKATDDSPVNKPRGCKPKAMKAQGAKGTKKALTKKDFINMGLNEWTEIRLTVDPYLSPRERVADTRFWNKEQAIIYDVVIENKNTEVVKQKHVDFKYIKEYECQFGGLIELCEGMGVKKIMEFEQDYNTDLVKQFYATVYFVNDREKTIKWMTGDDMHSAPFIDFVEAMHYEEQYAAGNAVACYGSGAPPHKKCLKWHYPKDSKDIGKMVGLKARYYYLMKLLNVTICAKGGNFGEISGHVIQLLYQARWAEGEIDVMQWMYETMRQVVKHRRSLCYAPYIYAFIKYVRAKRYKHLPPLEALFPANVHHQSYETKAHREKSKTSLKREEVGASSSGANRNSSGLRTFFTNLFSMCKATHDRTHSMHQIQKKHLREFREDRRQRGFNNVPHDGKDLDESDKEDFYMPALTDQDFEGWVGMPHPFAADEQEGARGEEEANTEDEGEEASDGTD